MALMVKDKIIYGSIKEVPSFGFTPVGTVIAVMGNTAPNHYLICNGQEVSIKSYPELALYFNEQFGSINHFGGNGTTTFCVPDLRGEFLRGTGTNVHANQGNGEDVGEHQNATEIPFFYSFVSGGIPGIQITRTSFGNNDTTKGTSSQNVYNPPSAIWTGTASNTGVVLTRPTNTSVLYCIAVHDIYIDARYNYSLEEQIVGRWIDGKPLYQKTFQFDNMIIDGTQQNFGSLSGLNIGSYAEVVRSTLNEDNYWTNPGILCVWVRVPQNNFGVRMVDGISRHGSLYFTIQYTKTIG